MAGADDRLRRLGEVGGMLREAALARLKAAAETCRKVEAELAALDAEWRECEGETDPAARAVMGPGRERRYLLRRAALNGALARARAEEAMRMQEAARAFGRDDALHRLIRRAAGD
ncbi:hypothetical protein NHN26_01060 [Rhodovulum tesquicola]|uniref:hypothetical protein n=1 Tax=Rhodovulum tesquicola TaxID=540254 RepID=UPI0020970111|nr:hypothetical protein [Rhodovulum tesquicola]MCO8143800.1 hypothetical protein [Rhodovulum tesquicola]